MDRAFDASQIVGTKVRGTVNRDDDEDAGWTSEWAVPWKGVRGAGRAPAPGTEWRMNVFRIDQRREDGELRGEYTAWSPPRVGDFHATSRFGRVVFRGDR
jgi:hypothetical protein